MLEQERDILRQSNKQIESVYGYMDILLAASEKKQKRKYDGLTTGIAKVKSISNQLAFGYEKKDGSLIGKLNSMIGNYIERRENTNREMSNDRIKTLGQKLKTLSTPKRLDTTNDFLRVDTQKNDIVTQLSIMDKLLDVNIKPSVNSSSTSTPKTEEKEESPDLMKAAGVLGLLVAGKKLLSKGGKETVEKTGEKVAIKTGEAIAKKAIGKGLKRIIPFAGVAFSLWDIASSLKDGIGDYRRFSSAGNTAAAKSAVGYTLLGTMGGLLGVVGSLAATTGVGIPIAIAINAVSIGLSVISDMLREKNLEKHKVEEKPKTQVSTPEVPLSNDTSSLFTQSDKIVKDTNKKIAKSLTVPKEKIEKKWYEDIFPDFVVRAASTVSSAAGSAYEAAKTYMSGGSGVGRVSSGYNVERDLDHTGKTRTHKGIDIAAPVNTPIYAPSDGTITYRMNRGGIGKGFGKYSILSSNGYQVLFGHLNEYGIKAADGKVKKGDIIGYVGNTGASKGNHIHLQVSKSNKVDDVLMSKAGNDKTMNPIAWLADSKISPNDLITKKMAAYEKGTNKIAKSGLALVHKDEMIIPNKNASKIRSVMDARQTIQHEVTEDISEDFWINTFMVELANVVKSEYLGVTNGV
jgi:murein DD-endopeptidase MepM/ murein hydrolase activator NlpD